MSSQRASQRVPKPTDFYDDTIEALEAPPKKRIKKDPPVVETASPNAVAVDPLTRNEQWWVDQPLPQYEPPVKFIIIPTSCESTLNALYSYSVTSLTRNALISLSRTQIQQQLGPRQIRRQKEYAGVQQISTKFLIILAFGSIWGDIVS